MLYAAWNSIISQLFGIYFCLLFVKVPVVVGYIIAQPFLCGLNGNLKQLKYIIVMGKGLASQMSVNWCVLSEFSEGIMCLKRAKKLKNKIVNNLRVLQVCYLVWSPCYGWNRGIRKVLVRVNYPVSRESESRLLDMLFQRVSNPNMYFWENKVERIKLF